MRRLVAALALFALLLVPVASFADDPILQPPIGSHSVTHPNYTITFWDLLLIALEI